MLALVQASSFVGSSFVGIFWKKVSMFAAGFPVFDDILSPNLWPTIGWFQILDGTYLLGFPRMGGTPIAGWYIIEHSIKMDDFGVPATGSFGEQLDQFSWRDQRPRPIRGLRRRVSSKSVARASSKRGTQWIKWCSSPNDYADKPACTTIANTMALFHIGAQPYDAHGAPSDRHSSSMDMSSPVQVMGWNHMNCSTPISGIPSI